VLPGGQRQCAGGYNAVATGACPDAEATRRYISVAVIQVRPPGYFTNISITTPIVSALKNYYR
jgi:hypothetical protein